jgi:elongation factor Ts
VEISAKAVMALREETGAGPMDCKKALTETGGDVEKAKKWLDERGLKKAEKVTGREVKQGLLASYIHQGRIGALVELMCETDFVARNEMFQKLADDIAKQIVAMSPIYASVEEIPEEAHNKAKEEFGDKIGKEFYSQAVLLNQAFVRDNSVTINDLILQAKSKLGENIVVRRFSRFELGK